ncbi:signal peptidase I [Kribbella sp. NPDC056861]|uniref:signal peptidase I n=1 Tax=Kribbella sp. NPDC056861 TaxID=3154857 RepID=UPI003416E150
MGTALAASVLLLRRRFISVQVVGTSMEPTLSAGDRILVRRSGLERVRRGQIVVIANPSPVAGDPSWLVKRVVALPGDEIPRDGVPALREVQEDVVPAGRLVLLGDNQAASYDSRVAGYFEAATLLGVAVRQRLTV